MKPACTTARTQSGFQSVMIALTASPSEISRTTPSVDALDDTAVLLADGMISIRPEVAMRCTKSLFSRQSLTSIPTAEAKRRSSCTVLLLRAGKRYLFEKIREAVENFIASFVKTIVRFLVSEEKGCQVVLQDTNTFSLSLSLPILPFLSIH